LFSPAEDNLYAVNKFKKNVTVLILQITINYWNQTKYKYYNKRENVVFNIVDRTYCFVDTKISWVY